MNVVFVSYGIPCVIVYLLTVLSIFSIRKQLSSSFVNIYIWTAAVNLLTYSNAWITLRLSTEKWFYFYYKFANGTGFLSVIHQFLLVYLYYAQNLNTFLLTLDRFFAIAATSYHGMWKRYYILVGFISYASTIALAFCIGEYYNSNYVSAFVYKPATDSFGVVTRDTARNTTVTQVIFGALTIIICSVLSVITWNRLRRMKTSKKAVIDRSFFFISLCIFIAQSLNIVILILVYFFFFVSLNLGVYMFIVTILIYTSDVFSLGPGIYTILVPGPIRRRFISMVTCGLSSRYRINIESVQSVKNTVNTATM